MIFHFYSLTICMTFFLKNTKILFKDNITNL
nr:MAG TPA: hypothetical protein [Caudoviricetes sp.]